MTTRAGVAAWSSAPWREEAVAWLDEQLAAAAIERTGEVEQPRVRPWATLLTASTSGGRVWLKAAAPETAFEVGLYELLQTVAPERALTPLGIDVERAWVLLPDGGSTLGERFSGTGLVDALATVLPRYGELQRALAPHADDLLALGVNDMRAAVMPRRFDEGLDAMRRYVERHGDAADRATYQRVATLREPVTGWCQRLAAAPVPPSLDHNDLHPANVFFDDANGPRFYDWGDSVVAHPFASMLLALGFMRFVEGAGDQAIVRLRDAYLEAFSDLAPHAELVETLELACRVGKIARALTWERAIGTMSPDEVDQEWASGPFEAMASLLDDSYIAAI